ncbi:lipid A biosynthesis acyltransferase [Ornithobacterium rhinotracheale]|uniref:lysophospholipid acyltransferase family protein n=1 Tax=Ornithobacterium rhinotracheale TaxID=28251 RepID=UPI00129CF5A6|nr:lysophospholipid acyltransferase family protein [Ornithobacterium rhinotracheale]MRI62924.1 lipid A biosynthesis acyltransferase [Ornithobacterium rhinotracheale]
MFSKITKNIIFIFALIPTRLLYIFADFLFFIQTYFVRYRRKVVIENLKKSFPTFSDEKIQSIAKKFNRHLCDYAVESIRALKISQRELDTRIEFKNLEVLNQIKAENKNCMLLCGHIFNWEWLIGAVHHLPTEKTYAVYHALSNKEINDIMRQSRERFNTHAIDMNETPRVMMKTPNDGNSTFLFVADQSPHCNLVQYDLEFLNQTTPVFIGFDKLARKLNYGVVYVNISSPKRGHFIFSFERLIPKNEFFEPNEIIHLFYQALENNIKTDPANWLWSHRRWKYKRGIDYWKLPS